jgi:citronellol/citronellal dehydrogenase
MSLLVLGFAAEFRGAGVAVNALWPRTVIATAAVENLLGGAAVTARARKPEIVADAFHAIVTRPSRDFSGRFCIDEDVLRDAGVRDFDQYAMTPGAELLSDLFV